MSEGHRSIQFRIAPRSERLKKLHGQVRMDAASLWNDLCKHHADWRDAYSKDPAFVFPIAKEIEKLFRPHYPNLHSHTFQSIIGEFLEACKATTKARQARRDNGEAPRDIEFPHRKLFYRDVPYCNEGARILHGQVVFSNGRKQKGFSFPIPKGIKLPPGRLMEARLGYNTITLVFSDRAPETPEEMRARKKTEKKAAQLAKKAARDAEKAAKKGVFLPPAVLPTVGVDLGLNTLIAATDGIKFILISGKEIRSNLRQRDKRLAEIRSRQSTCFAGDDDHKPSRMYRRLQRRKKEMLTKARNRIKDAVHKATHKLVTFFPDADIVTGPSFNAAAHNLGRIQAQQVSQMPVGRVIRQMAYKARSCSQKNEAWSSQACPACGAYHKNTRRIFICPECRFSAPRDAVGAWNIRQLGRYGEMTPTENWKGKSWETIVHCYPQSIWPKASRSGGTPASGSWSSMRTSS